MSLPQVLQASLFIQMVTQMLLHKLQPMVSRLKDLSPSQHPNSHAFGIRDLAMGSEHSEQRMGSHGS